MALDPAQQEMIDFVTSLPPSVNPYEATAAKIAQRTTVATPVLWGRILRRIIGFQFCVMFFQALTVLWLRKRAKKLKFLRFNKLGLIHVEVLNEIVALMLLFSILTVLDLVTQEFVERGLFTFSHKLILRTCKFPIAADVCWLFLWICGIETVMSSTSLRVQERSGLSIKLSLRIRLAANTLLLLAMTVPGILLVAISWVATIHLRAIEKSAKITISNLLKAAPSYQPHNSQTFSIFALLQPAQKIIPESKAFSKYIRWALVLYLVQHLLIMTLYIPTSFIALRGLRRQTITESSLQRISAMESISQGQGQIPSLTRILAREKAAAEKVRKRLITHAVLLYVDTFLYCPTLMYMLSYHGVDFFNNPTWVLIEQVAIHGPNALIGNIILAFLIQNARYVHKNSENPSLASTKSSMELDETEVKTTPQEKSQTRSLPIY